MGYQFIQRFKQKIINWLALYLERPSKVQYHAVSVPNPHDLRAVLQPCDVLLIEGNLRYSEIIKYVTQSTWSHCALYIGSEHKFNDHSSDPPCLIEAMLSEGVVISPLSHYFNLNTRILRPVSLDDTEKYKIISFCIEKIGNLYDIDNVLDLLKYYVPMSRIFLRNKGDDGNIFGSGDPERVICSSLIAQAFQSVNYPILPEIEKIKQNVTLIDKKSKHKPETEILRKRHFSLYSPRDFDLSPFFKVIKPTLEKNFDHKNIKWE